MASALKRWPVAGELTCQIIKTQAAFVPTLPTHMVPEGASAAFAPRAITKTSMASLLVGQNCLVVLRGNGIYFVDMFARSTSSFNGEGRQLRSAVRISVG